MDQVKKFTTNELIILGGCVAMFLGYFLKWFGVSFGGFSVSVSGSEYFLQGTLPWLLSIALGAVIIIRKLTSVQLPELPIPWGQAYLIAAGVSAVLVLLRLITGDGGTDRKLGLFLASLGVIAQAVGAFLAFQAKEDDAPRGSTPPSPF